MSAAHVLQSPKFACAVQLLHVEIFPLKNGGFHEHVVFSGRFAGRDNIFEFLNGHSHGNGAATMLARLEHLDGKGRVCRRRRNQMNGIDARIVDDRLKIGGAAFLRYAVPVPRNFKKFFILIAHIYLVYIRMLLINGNKLQSKAQARYANTDLPAHSNSPLCLMLIRIACFHMLLAVL